MMQVSRAWYLHDYLFYVNCTYYGRTTASAGWAKLNEANVVSFVVVKHILENVDNFWQ